MTIQSKIPAISQNKEYDQLENRKSSMTFNIRNMRHEAANVLSEVKNTKFPFEGRLRLEMIHYTILLIIKLSGSKVVAVVISTSSRPEDLFILLIDIPCKGILRSTRFYPRAPLSSDTLKYAGIRQWSKDSHIEGLQTLETLHSAVPNKSDKSPSYRSEALLKSKTFNYADQLSSGNSDSCGTEVLQRSKTVQKESLTTSNNSEGLQTSDELYSNGFNYSTHPPFEGARVINPVLQNAFPLILKFWMFMVFLTQAACEDVQLPINCTIPAVLTSPNYPSRYPQYKNKNWFVTAPEGRRIRLTFNTVSLGSNWDGVEVLDTVDHRNRQRYNGEEDTFPPFLSRKNTLLLRFFSHGNPTGKGFNISASCYELSETRVGRLTGGHTPAEGFLELQAESGGEWMRVCGEHSADRVAEVVCGELGFPGAKEVSYEDGGCSSEGADRDCIWAPSCENYTYRSQDCSASPENCTSSKVVKVKCFEPEFGGCYDLGNTQLQNGSSYDSTSQCVTSCRGDTSKAIAIINGSECFCSTIDDIVLSSFSQVEARPCTPHKLVYNAYFGFCNPPDDVMNGSWDYDTTWFGSFVHLTCNQGYRLNGSGTLQCLTEVSSYLLVWNGSIPTCEMMTETSPSVTTEQSNAARAIASSMTALLTALLICIICAVVWKCRKRITHKQRAAPSITATRESDLANRTGALPRTPIDDSQPNILLSRSQHVTRTHHNLNNSSTFIHPSHPELLYSTGTIITHQVILITTQSV